MVTVHPNRPVLLLLAVFAASCACMSAAWSQVRPIPGGPMMPTVRPPVQAPPPVEPPLMIGSPPPPVSARGLANGAAIRPKAASRPTVILFYASWSQPCQVCMPHIGMLARRYRGKAAFVGIRIWERSPRGASERRSQAFFRSAGARTDFPMAIDGPGGVMARTWMQAARRDTVPTVFVVGKDGTIAWIGHPLSLDAVLAQCVAGTYKPNLAAIRRARRGRARSAVMQALSIVEINIGRREYKLALERIDRALKEHPSAEAELAPAKIRVLTQSDQPALYPYARKLADGIFKNNALMLNQLAWPMVEEGSVLRVRDYNTALAIAIRAGEASAWNEPYILDTVALAYYRTGNRAKALELQRRALSLINGPRVMMDMQAVGEMRDRLKMYERGR